MKLALHRSIIFWSGILVMAFICWAWRDSFQRFASVEYRDTVISTSNGGITVRQIDDRNSPFKATSRINPFPHPEWTACQPAFFLRGEDQRLNTEEEYEAHIKQLQTAANARDLYRSGMRVESSRSSLLFIPHFLLLLAVALLWIALLGWRTRRRNRAANKDSVLLTGISPADH